MMGESAPSAYLLMTQNWEELPINQVVFQPFRGTQQAGEISQQELLEQFALQRKYNALQLGGNNLMHLYRTVAN